VEAAVDEEEEEEEEEYEDKRLGSSAYRAGLRRRSVGVEGVNEREEDDEEEEEFALARSHRASATFCCVISLDFEMRSSIEEIWMLGEGVLSVERPWRERDDCEAVEVSGPIPAMPSPTEGAFELLRLLFDLEEMCCERGR
jgi:hypothetical protein